MKNGIKKIGQTIGQKVSIIVKILIWPNT